MDGFGTFGDMPDLCHRNPDVYKALMEYTRWLIEDIGYDGFRFDFVKGYGPWMVKGIAEYRYNRGGNLFRPFDVGECWDSDCVVDEWLTSINNAFMDNPVSAFDFPLHYSRSSRISPRWGTCSPHRATNCSHSRSLRRTSSRAEGAFSQRLRVGWEPSTSPSF